MDLILCDEDDAEKIYYGDGTGAFTFHANLEATTRTCFQVVTGDFNNDILVDVAISTTSAQNQYIYLGQ